MTGTTNLNLTKPTVGADADTWGGELNGDLDILDALLQTAITGLTLSTAGSSGTFGVAPGAASGMVLATAYTKTTSAWVVGTGAGALDTGSIANNSWYHVWLIQRSDTGVVDLLISTSAASPTMPTNYTRKRRIGSMKTDGSGQWIKFSQMGDEFLWDVAVEDALAATPGVTTATSVALSVPLGVKTYAIGSVVVNDGLNNATINISSLDVSDQAASSTGTLTVFSGNGPVGASFSTRTNTSSQVRVRVGSTTCAYSINTRGWIDTRGN